MSWELLTTEPNIVTGDYEVIAMLKAELEDGHRAILSVRCQAKAKKFLQFMVFTSIETPTKDAYQSITYRFDNDEPVSKDWYVAYYGSENAKDVTGLFDLTDAESLIERLRTAERFGIKFEGMHHRSHTVVFDNLDGFEESYLPVQEACQEANDV